MQLYDLLYIIPAPNTKEDVKQINQNIKEKIKNLKGIIVKEKNLGNKKLAYPIEKKDKGFYISIQFKLDRSNLKEIKNQLSSSSNILRHMITKTSESKKQEKKSKEKAQEKNIKEEKREVKEKKKKSKKEDDNIKNINDKIDDILNN